MELKSCGGAWTRRIVRRTGFSVMASQSGSTQEWRIQGPALDGRGQGLGRGGRGPGRGRASRPVRPFKEDFREDEERQTSGSRSFNGAKPNRRMYDSMSPRRTGTSATPLPSKRAPARPSPPQGQQVNQDPFSNLNTWIQQQHANGAVVRRETWEKLLSHVGSAAQARQALELMLRDAAVRGEAGWDWATHGYGQTAFQLVQVAAQAGAPEVAERLLERREELHLTLNKDLLPSLIRKVAAAISDYETTVAEARGRGGGSGRGSDDDYMDACVDVVQRLYEQEAALRGANSPEAAYELGRVLRRARDVRGVHELHSQVVREGLAVRERMLEDLERWLAKRGVRV